MSAVHWIDFSCATTAGIVDSSKSSSQATSRGHQGTNSRSNNNENHPLGIQLRTYIYQQLQQAQQDPNIQVIVVAGCRPGSRMGLGSHFSVGADLNEFTSTPVPTAANGINATKATNHIGLTSTLLSTISLIDVVTAIESSSKPVIACIEGYCLGGGLEVAMACHYRICSATAQLGLPEVHVGVIPGAGGTQRLPRLIGLPMACQLILTGKSITGREAFKLQLVDAVAETPPTGHDHGGGITRIPQVLEKMVEEWALRVQKAPFPRVGQLPLRESPIEAHVILHVAGLQLPLVGHSGSRAAIEALRAVYTTPNLAAGMQMEAKYFFQTLLSSEGRARRHAFFAVRQAQKVLPRDIVKNNNGNNTDQNMSHHPLLAGQPVPVAVIGSGTMGGGIAIVLLLTGYTVYLVDIDHTALQKGIRLVQSTLDGLVKRKKLTPSQAAEAKDRLRQTQNLADLTQCQLVVEAVIENMKVKQDIFQRLNEVTKPECLLLSNTSTLDIDEMASVLDPSRRERFAGWHFFSPAHVMKLVEIVVGRETNRDTVIFMQLLTKHIQKIGVIVGNCDGFCGNRMLKPYSAETVLLLTEGNNSIAQVDQVFLQFGMALGPLQMADLAGNDVGYNIRKARGWVRNNEASSSVPPNRPQRYTELADVMVSRLGRLGQKSSKGFYDYDPTIGKGRIGLHSPEMAAVIDQYRSASARGVKHSPEEMIVRVLYPLVNEGFKCLEEGITRSPGDIDVVYLYGYGWPAFRGGPMYWADHEVTLPVLLDSLRQLSRQFPTTEHFVPSQLLLECVSKGLTVEDYYKLGLPRKTGKLSRL